MKLKRFAFIVIGALVVNYFRYIFGGDVLFSFIGGCVVGLLLVMSEKSGLI